MVSNGEKVSTLHPSLLFSADATPWRTFCDRLCKRAVVAHGPCRYPILVTSVSAFPVSASPATSHLIIGSPMHRCMHRPDSPESCETCQSAPGYCSVGSPVPRWFGGESLIRHKLPIEPAPRNWNTLQSMNNDVARKVSSMSLLRKLYVHNRFIATQILHPWRLIEQNTLVHSCLSMLEPSRCAGLNSMFNMEPVGNTHEAPCRRTIEHTLAQPLVLGWQ